MADEEQKEEGAGVEESETAEESQEQVAGDTGAEHPETDSEVVV